MNIRDIANKANVSPSTVSKIINNKDDSISAETRKRVLDIVKKYNYTPYGKVIDKNPNLIRGYLVSYLANLDKNSGVSLKALQEEINSHHYDLVILNTKKNNKENEEVLEQILKKKYHGLIYEPYDLKEENEELLKEADIPVLIINSGENKNRGPYIHYINQDFYKLGYEATKYCQQNGFLKIGLAFENKLDIYKVDRILEAYSRRLSENNIEYDSNLITANNNFEKLINSECEIIICENENVAYELYRYCNKYRIIIGKDLSILCMNKDKDNLLPQLSYIYFDDKDFYKSISEYMINEIEKTEDIGSFELNKKVHFKKGESVLEKGKKEKIIIVGSMNMDTIMRLPVIPSKGDTLIIDNLEYHPGGKGANQAVGVSKLGLKPYLIGCVGKDGDGRVIIDNMRKYEVNIDGVLTISEDYTGQAYITLPSDGESSIYIYPGANIKLSSEYLDEKSYLFDDAQFCLISTEVSLDFVVKAIDIAYEKGIKSIVKPAAIDKIYEKSLEKVYLFIPNHYEAERLVPDLSLEDKADYFLKQGVENVIITLGEDGAFYKNREWSKYYPVAPFPTVDTTGGADAFISALVSYLIEDEDFDKAIKYANYAAGICVTQEGVQGAMATKKQMDNYKLLINK